MILNLFIWGYLPQELLSSMARIINKAINILFSYSEDTLFNDCWAWWHLYLIKPKIIS